MVARLQLIFLKAACRAMQKHADADRMSARGANNIRPALHSVLYIYKRACQFLQWQSILFAGSCREVQMSDAQNHDGNSTSGAHYRAYNFFKFAAHAGPEQSIQCLQHAQHAECSSCVTNFRLGQADAEDLPVWQSPPGSQSLRPLLRLLSLWPRCHSQSGRIRSIVTPSHCGQQACRCMGHMLEPNCMPLRVSE